MGNASSLGQILVINCGSSSIKFTLMDRHSESMMARGLAQRLGEFGASIDFIAGDHKSRASLPGGTHAEALDHIITQLHETFGETLQITGVGHRVVHGGEFFSRSVLITPHVIECIEACVPLAPLHNPAHLTGIRAALACFPKVPQVVVFDTAFHQTMPPHAFHYAIPYDFYERRKARRYGAHGTSHQYVAQETARRLDRPIQSLHLLTAHLGNGCSACAVREGHSVDTTMGLTPLEGLMMGTRSGDVDPNLHQFMAMDGLSLAEITEILNKKSGLLGVSGLSNDMRTLCEAADGGHERAQLAFDLFCYRLAKGLLGLTAALDRVDALVFTGGIGENSSAVREQTLRHLRTLQPALDPALNSTHGAAANGRITQPDSRLLVMVVPTNEELMIARETATFL